MRIPVPLAHANRLLNHGPTTLVSTAHGGMRNVMAAAWADGAVWADGEWRFTPGIRTLHHMKGGVFFATGEQLAARR